MMGEDFYKIFPNPEFLPHFMYTCSKIERSKNSAKWKFQPQNCEILPAEKVR